MDGVVAVVTAADIPEVQIPIRLQFAETPEALRLLQPPLARDRVRYVGEPVAVVVAEDAYIAEDAAERVELDLEELPVDAVLHDELASNVVNTFPTAYGPPVDEVLAEADVVLRQTLRVQRHTGVPLETRGLLAEVIDGELVVHGAAKVKHFNRDVLAAMLDFPPDRIRLVEGHVGGGFGVRGEFYPEDFLVPWLALRLGRPVKWIEDRYEHFIAANHSREQSHEFELGVSRDGVLLAFRSRFACDLGAYVRTQGVLLPLITTAQLPGPYAWRAFEIEARAILSPKTPAGTFRAPGVTEATFVRERMIDRAAAELRIDPFELRRRNLIDAEAMPFSFELRPEQPPLVYESGDFRQFFETVMERGRVDELRAEVERRRESGCRTGLGVAVFTEMSAVGPFEQARIVPARDGTFTVHVGVSSLGQGVDTVLAQIAAEELGVPLDSIRVDHADTGALVTGFGAFASRSTVFAGNAVAVAAHALRVAADEAGVPLDAAALAERGLEGDGRYERLAPSFSFGAGVSLVDVDVETGQTTVLRHIAALDVGRAINPALVRGQLAGGAAQGIAGALFEELRYDEDAQPLSTSFADYLMPTAAELPEVDVVVLEHRVEANPLGIKGAGEGGVAGAPAAVANAVADALDVDVSELPLTLDRVRSLLRR